MNAALFLGGMMGRGLAVEEAPGVAAGRLGVRRPAEAVAGVIAPEPPPPLPSPLALVWVVVILGLQADGEGGFSSVSEWTGA